MSGIDRIGNRQVDEVVDVYFYSTRLGGDGHGWQSSVMVYFYGTGIGSSLRVITCWLSYVLPHST